VNVFERMLDGYARLWRRSQKAVLFLLLVGGLLVLLGCLIQSGLSIGMGLAILICLSSFAWLIGEPGRWPGE
jgi:hypothetical protein